MVSNVRQMILGLALVLIGGLACTAQAIHLDSLRPDLKGTRWELNSFGPQGSERVVARGTRLVMVFTNGNRVGGTDGCNIFNGEYEVRSGTVVFHNLTQSRAGCTDQSLWQKELEYLQALGRTDRYEIHDDLLILQDQDGSGNLIFTRSRPPGLVGAQLDKG